jgi:hypothetical protein
MDVQQGGTDPGQGAGPAGSGEDEGSRVGLIVGVALALIAALVAVVVLLNRDSDDDTDGAASTATPTVTATVTPSPTATPTETSEPTQTSSPAEYPDLMADSIGDLRLRMTKQEAVGTGLVTEEQTAKGLELVADPDVLPGVYVCWDPDQDALTSFTVKDGSPIVTPDGIGVGSTSEDLRAAYGVLVQEREENGEPWYLVPVDDVGYAFFPTDRELVMLSGTDLVLADIRPGTEPC